MCIRDSAYLALQEDGSAQLAAGVPDMGQGIATTLSQVAASSLGIDVEQVHIVFGDTQSTPYDIGSHASRTLYSAGTAVNAAGKDARGKLFAFLAGQMLSLIHIWTENGLILPGRGAGA